MEKIIDGIYVKRMPLPYSFQEVNIYFIEGENGFTVIDTGDTEHSKEVWQQLLRTNVQIEKIVLTHVHPDHCGLAQWLQQTVHVPVWTSQQSLAAIAEIRDLQQASTSIFSLLQTYIDIEKPPRQAPMEDPYRFTANYVYEDGENLPFGRFTFQAIWTPGHAFDQYCFYEATQQVMIVGDHILFNTSPMLELRGRANENPLANYLQSLERIKAYETKLALPGHGNLITDIHAEINKLVQKHDFRLNQLIAFLQTGPKTGLEIVEHTYKNSDPRFFIEQLVSVVGRLLYLSSIQVIDLEPQQNRACTYKIKETKPLETLASYLDGE